MALPISKMEALGYVSAGDRFEICHKGEDDNVNKTFSVTAREIANYCKRLNNGGYNGTTTKDLNEFTYADSGVYFWTGDAPLVGMPTSGILEVLSYYDQTETPKADLPVVVQRLTSGNDIYCRTWTQLTSWSAWAVLKNVNGNKILSGKTSDASVNFNALVGMSGTDHFFSQTPTVTITPINTTNGAAVYVANIIQCTQDMFTVARFASETELKSVVSTTTNKYTPSGNQSESLLEESKVYTESFGKWATASFEYYWVATVDG